MRLRLKFREFKFIFLCLILIVFIFGLKIHKSFKSEKDSVEKLESTVKSCGKFLEDDKIIRDNIFWQVLKSKKRSIKLFNAYLDVRMQTPVVRVTLLTSQMDLSKDTIYCQFWFGETSNPRVVKANEIFLTGRESILKVL